MKLLLIHQSFASHDQPGGTRHLELGAHAVRQGHDVNVVASNVDYLSGRRILADDRWITRQEIDGVHVLRSYAYASRQKTFVMRIVSDLTFMTTAIVASLRAGPVDVVMGTAPPLFQLFSAWIAARLRRRPLLIEVRDVWLEAAVEMGIITNPLVRKAAFWTERFLYKRADHLVVNSPAYRESLIGKGIPGARITLIPNGVDPSMFDPDADGAEMRRQWEANGKFVVTYTGALGHTNDIDTILRAANRLRADDDVLFVLVGDGKRRPHLEQTAKSLELANVKFAGTHPKQQMGAVLAASDACVATLQNLPTLRTTYPNKVFDYMAAGRPTVLAIDGVIREVVEAAQGGLFVQPGDDQALADAVRTLKAEPAAARRMGRSARSYVVEHFNRADHAQQFVELLEGLRGRR